jgi:hypothetical protein
MVFKKGVQKMVKKEVRDKSINDLVKCVLTKCEDGNGGMS